MDVPSKRYLKEFLIAMAGYTLMVPLSIRLLRGHEHTPLGYALAFLPIIPSAFAMWVAPLLILLWGLGLAIARRRYV